MSQLLPSEDQNVLDRLNAKSRQLFFQLGSQHNKQRREQLINQLTLINAQIKQRIPYQIYSKLQKQQTQLRNCLQETQNALKQLEQENKELLNGINQLGEKKKDLLKNCNVIKESIQLKFKIDALQKELKTNSQIEQQLEVNDFEDHYDAIQRITQELRRRNNRIQEIIKNQKQIKRNKEELLALQNKRWQQTIQNKRQLQQQLHLIQGEKLIYQALESQTLGKQSTKSSRDMQPVYSSLRDKKKFINKMEVLINKKQNKQDHKLYYIWAIILIIWAAWLLLSKNEIQDSVCL